MLHIQLLGGVRVQRQDMPVTPLLQPRLQALLAYLILHAGAPQPRIALAARFWPDLPETKAGANLRTLLFRLRQTLPHTESCLEITAQSACWRKNSPATDGERPELATAEAFVAN